MRSTFRTLRRSPIRQRLGPSRFSSTAGRDTKGYHGGRDKTHQPQEKRIILPSMIGMAEWREKVSLDEMEVHGSTNIQFSRDNNSNSNKITNGIILPDVSQLYRPDLHLPSAPTNWKEYETNTPLTQQVIALIGVSGRPLSTADFMRLALTHPEHGYYTRAVSRGQRRRGPRGDVPEDEFDHDDYDDDEYDTANLQLPVDDAQRSNNASTSTNTASATNANGLETVIGGDFVTAPEVSNVFGECLGVWFVTVWSEQQQKSQIGDEKPPDSQKKNRGDWQWLECGPGKGTLMVDLLRFTLQLSSSTKTTTTKSSETSSLFGDGCRHIHFVEQSPVFRQQQRDALVQATFPNLLLKFDDPNVVVSKPPNSTTAVPEIETATDGPNVAPQRVISVHWHDTLAAFQWWQKTNVPDSSSLLPTFVVGQEFLDALPVYTFEKTKHGYWRERLVDVALRDDLEDEIDTTTIEKTTVSASPNFVQLKKPRLRIVLAPEVTPPLKVLLQTDNEGYLTNDNMTNDNIPVDSVVEVCPEAILVVQDVADIIERQGGAALFIDYGSDQGSRDSLRGFSRHEQVHFLSQPGLVDITADVDFVALRHAVNTRKTDEAAKAHQTVRAFGPVQQGEFLMAMGIQERVVQLMERDDCSDEMADNLYKALIRLASPEEMGQLYKVLSIVPKDALPPGF